MSNAIIDKNEEELKRLWDTLAGIEPGTQAYQAVMQEIVALSATRTAIAKEINDAAAKEKSIDLDIRYKDAQMELERDKLTYEKERDKKDGKRKWLEIILPAGLYALIYGVSIALEKYGDIVIPKVAQTVSRGLKPKK